MGFSYFYYDLWLKFFHSEYYIIMPYLGYIKKYSVHEVQITCNETF